MNPILKLIGEAEDFSEYEDILKLDAEQEKTLFNRELPASPEEAAKYAYEKAKELGKGNVPKELELQMASSAIISYLYALYVLNGPFLLGEPAMSKSPSEAYDYAIRVLKRRFLLGEPAIFGNFVLKVPYCDHFGLE